MTRPVIYSLFSGAGGLDLGLHQAGFNIKVAHDNDPDCVATLITSGLYEAVMNIDAYEVVQHDYIDYLRGLCEGEELFAVVGGPPCQSFSVAGKQRGLADSRGMLVDVFINTVAHLQPRFAVLENVPRLKTIPFDKNSPNPKKRERGSALQYIKRRFTAIGYTVTTYVLNAADYGAAQNRERLVLICSRDNELVASPVFSHRGHEVTLRDAIEDLMDVDGSEHCYEFSEKQRAYMRYIPEGGNWHDLPVELRREAMGSALKEDGRTNGGCTGFYRRLAWDKPAPTLTTNPMQRATMLCHPSQDRPLSVLEYARIQGFPDEYGFAGSLSSRYRQIGNAVPVPLGRLIGELLIGTAMYT